MAVEVVQWILGMPHNTQGPTISAVIIAKNEEKMIANCLDTLRWCDEMIVVDSCSEDHTPEIAQRAGARVFSAKDPTFADARNIGKQHASSDWLLYIDADERLTPALKKEIQSIVSLGNLHAFHAYSLSRNNIHYGKWMEHGGWQHDRVVRLFEKKHLSRWEGEVHEHAVVDGIVGELKEPLIHLTHRNLRDCLEKSIVWTDVEAHLFLKAGHRKIGWLTLVKVTLFAFFDRFIKQQAYKDGDEGMIEAMVQAQNRFFVYERLWELQQNPSLPDKYVKIEKDIERLWQHEDV